MLFVYLCLVNFSFFRAFCYRIDLRTIFCWCRCRSNEFSFTYAHVHLWGCTGLWNCFKHINKKCKCPFLLLGLSLTLFRGAAKILFEYLAKMDWRFFWPELFWDFPRFYLVMHVHLNQIEGFDVCFNSWWLVSFLIFLKLCFLLILVQICFSYLAVSSRASHVGFF